MAMRSGLGALSSCCILASKNLIAATSGCWTPNQLLADRDQLGIAITLQPFVRRSGKAFRVRSLKQEFGFRYQARELAAEHRNRRRARGGMACW